MLATPKMKQLYKEIQNKLFYMIPEKWDRIYLYASVVEGINHLETGEMFFYYFPKGILKKDPVNVYEVPNKFNIDDTKYFKLADELYGVIKQLRKEYIDINDKAWSNVTIAIENFKFIIEYDFDDLKNSPYSSYDRHILFRYKYLKTSINTYSKKERNIIMNYLDNMQYVKEDKDTYVEGIYQVAAHNVIDYNKEESIIVDKTKKQDQTSLPKYSVEQQVEEMIRKETKTNQILNFDKWKQ